MRRGLVAIAALCTIVALALYLDACSRSGTETSTTLNLPRSGQTKSMVRAEKRTELPPAETRPDSLIVGILGIGAVLLIAGAFYDRLDEIVIAGTTVRLRRDEVAAAVATITARTDNPKTAEKAIGTTIRRLGTRERAGRTVKAQDVREAAEDAIAELVPDLGDEVEVTETPSGPSIEISLMARARDATTVKVRMTDHYLPKEAFGSPAETIAAADPTGLGRRLYAVDALSEAVLAALSFEVPEDADAPLVITALATDQSLPEIARRVPALRLTQYLDAIASRLNRPQGAVIRLGEPTTKQQVELGSLQFRAAAPEDLVHLPEGLYWRQIPS